MLGRQARRSGLVMGFEIHMIAGSRACSTFTRLTHPTITKRTSPHFAETLGVGGAGAARLSIWRRIMSSVQRVQQVLASAVYAGQGSGAVQRVRLRSGQYQRSDYRASQ
jgi:hypothetical protein